MSDFYRHHYPEADLPPHVTELQAQRVYRLILTHYPDDAAVLIGALGLDGIPITVRGKSKYALGTSG